MRKIQIVELECAEQIRSLYYMYTSNMVLNSILNTGYWTCDVICQVLALRSVHLSSVGLGSWGVYYLTVYNCHINSIKQSVIHMFFGSLCRIWRSSVAQTAFVRSVACASAATMWVDRFCYLLSSSRSGISPKHQSARMSKITNDGLTESDTGCFIAVPIWQRWASKG